MINGFKFACIKGHPNMNPNLMLQILRVGQVFISLVVVCICVTDLFFVKFCTWIRPRQLFFLISHFNLVSNFWGKTCSQFHMIYMWLFRVRYLISRYHIVISNSSIKTNSPQFCVHFDLNCNCTAPRGVLIDK